MCVQMTNKQEKLVIWKQWCVCADDKQAGIVGHMETVVCVCRRQTSKKSWSYGNSGVCVQMTNKQEELVIWKQWCVCADDKQAGRVGLMETVVCVCR